MAVIAVGFVLRAVAGAAVISARISPWLLVCTFLLALFLALCKRRHERGCAAASREVLKIYHPVALDALIVATAVVTVGVYSGYTLAPDTVVRFGTRGLVFTAAFVALGVGRYLALVYGRGRQDDVGRPEKVLLSDWVLWVILAGYEREMGEQFSEVMGMLHEMGLSGNEPSGNDLFDSGLFSSN